MVPSEALSLENLVSNDCNRKIAHVLPFSSSHYDINYMIIVLGTKQHNYDTISCLWRNHILYLIDDFNSLT